MINKTLFLKFFVSIYRFFILLFKEVVLIAVLFVLTFSFLFLFTSDSDEDKSRALRFMKTQSFTSWFDCNDLDNKISPKIADIPNDGVDQNCDGIDFILPDDLLDKDKDGRSIQSGDCNDNDDKIYPDALELDDDMIDSNCDGFDNDLSAKELVITENVITPNLPVSPPASNIIRQLQGKELLLNSPISDAYLDIEFGFDESAGNPDDLIGIGIYIEADIYDPNDSEKNYWEIIGKLGSEYIVKDGKCTNRLRKSEFTLESKIKKSSLVSDISLSSVPISFSNNCFSSHVDVLNMLNTAYNANKPIRIAIYTTDEHVGKVIKATLRYTGEKINVK